MRLLTLLLLGAASAGCTSLSPGSDAAFGDSVRQAKALQTLNPHAGQDDPSLPTLDGISARNALVRQRDSFKEPPQTFQILGVGGVKPSGTGR